MTVAEGTAEQAVADMQALLAKAASLVSTGEPWRHREHEDATGKMTVDWSSE